MTEHWMQQFWPYVTGSIALLGAVLAGGHAVLYKRDPRAAVAWLGIVVLLPFFGPLLYLLFGINRIQRRASILRTKPAAACLQRHALTCSDAALEKLLPDDSRHLSVLERATGSVTEAPLLHANEISILRNGTEAYPAMLDAIENATASLSLATYIFAYDKAGKPFVDALSRAVKRGVEVRIIVDEVGSRYSFPNIAGILHKRGIRTALFMPSFVPWRTPYLNLRNHRKLMVADGRVGFTGGLNIRANNLLEPGDANAIRDLHFRVVGPVVGQLQDIFATDWAFATGEILKGPAWFRELKGEGGVIARGIPDGPDEDFDKLRPVILAAIGSAQRSIRILTPYFLPELTLTSALNVAAMRGVRVEIVIPGQSNLRMVDWASRAQLWQVLERGCRIWLSPRPFDHAKLMIVDDVWSMVGSANWDPRSLRLNFEFGLECYDSAFAAKLRAEFEARQRISRQISLDEVDNRPLPIRLRDGLARLFSPYL